MTGQSEANIHAAILIEKGLTIWLERQLFLVGTQREIPGSCDIKLPPNTPFVPPSRLSLRFLVFHISCCIIRQLIQNYSKMTEKQEQQTKVSDDRFRYGLLKRLNNLRKANFRCDTRCYVTATCYLLPAITSKLLFCSEFEVKENRDNLVELKEIKSSTMKMFWSLCI